MSGLYIKNLKFVYTKKSYQIILSYDFNNLLALLMI